MVGVLLARVWRSPRRPGRMSGMCIPSRGAATRGVPRMLVATDSGFASGRVAGVLAIGSARRGTRAPAVIVSTVLAASRLRSGVLTLTMRLGSFR